MSHIGKKRMIRSQKERTGKKSRVYLRTAVSNLYCIKNSDKMQ